MSTDASTEPISTIEPRAGENQVISDAPAEPRVNSEQTSSLSKARHVFVFLRLLVAKFLSLFMLLFFPPAAFPYFAKFSFRVFKRFWIFPLEPFQLTSPAIAIGPVLCLGTYYGFPEPMAAFIFTVVQIYVYYVSSSDSPWEGARNFVQWLIILALSLTLLGYYFQTPVLSTLWALIADSQVPFPPKFILLYSAIFGVIYFAFLIHQMFTYRISVKKGYVKVFEWGKKAITHNAENYDYGSYLHDAGESPLKCTGVRFSPRQQGIPAYELPIVSGGASIVELLIEAK
jgi:hypothetical protein